MAKAKEMATIDTCMLVIRTQATEGNPSRSLAMDTASKVEVNVAIETQDAVKLIIKGVLKAQKRAINTITGNTIVVTDNVMTPELIQVLQGGTITYDADDPTKIIGYAPPVAGSTTVGEVFELDVYSAVYDAAGLVVEYEKVTYPNCEGVPVAVSSEDGVFRAPEYTINSAPKTGQSPYTISWVAALPSVV